MKRFLERHGGALIAWIVVVVLALVMMPNTTRLIREYGQTKIPASAQSQVADTIQNGWGRGQGNTRQVVVVFNNGKHALTATQKENIAQTIQNFRDNQKHYHIKDVLAASDNAETKKQLVSKDKSTELVQLLVSKKDTVRQMNADITKAAKTNGVKTYVTGSDILNDDFDKATADGIKKTEVIAAVFIFIVLIIVFRSPIVPVISLLTVGVSVLTSLSIVMNLVDYFGFPLSSFTQVFMVVVLFGIGTDYNILLYDQFKEELSSGASAVAATKKARRIAGRTILYSGSSVLIGFTALALAKFSIYRSAVGVAVGVAVLLLVLLTLNPFFMAMLGQKMFWPIKGFKGGSTSRLWHGLSRRSVFHPFISLAIVLVVTVPFLFMYSNHLNYDTLDELSDSLPAKQGFHVVQDHFSKGTAEPSTLYIKSSHNLSQEQYLKLIDQVTKKLQKADGVKTVASVTQPGGSAISKLYVNNQLGTVTKGMKSAGKGLNKVNKGLNTASDKLGSSNMSSGLSSVQQLIDGTDQLTTGSKQISSGAGQLASGANTLSGGLNTLNSSTGTLAAGVTELTSGAYVLDNGLGQYTSGVSSLNSGLGTLANNSSKLTAGVNTLSSAGQQLPLAVAGLTAYNTQINKGVGTIMSSLNAQQSKMNDLSSGVSQLNSLASQAAALKKQVDQAKQIEPELTKMMTLLNSLQSAKSQISSLQTKANTLKSTQSTLKTALTSIGTHDASAIGADKTIVAAAQKIVDDDSATAASKAQAQTIITTANNNVNNNLSTNVKTLSSLNQQMSNLEVPDMSGLNSLVDQLPSDSQISSLKQQLSSMTTMLDNADKMLSATSDLSAETKQLNQLPTMLSQLTSGLSQLQTASGSAASVAQQLNSQVNGSGVDTSSAATIQATIGNSQFTSQISQLTSGLQQYISGVDQAATGASTLNASSSALQSGANQLAGGLNQMNQKVPALTSGVSQLATGANQLASGATQLGNKAPQLTAGLIQVNNGQRTMYTTLQGLVSQMQTLHDGLVDASSGITKINKGVGSADDYLTGLKGSDAAKTYYVPKSVLKGKTYKQALDTYLSEDHKAAKFTIVLDSNPSSAKSMARIDKLQTQVQNELKGTPLAGAKVAIGGQTASISDTHHIASSDFLRTAAIMLVGILIALMFITRSILQPFYILGTLILAYITSLSLTRWLSTAFLGQNMLTWNTPFFSFVMLIALGVDYSIFLMMKYREFGVNGGTPSERITAAASVIGAVVISAAIILSGTFAALMPSGVLTLIQVALAVIIGLVILVIILPMVISSLIRLTYPLSDKLNEKRK
ncbi:MMPL family transporter [Loigolactobacillus bifermentans]|uniref:MMPL family transporter n=1 Tax=Loigolactobacillus bifermentans TaxID=1607 RepID=UPI00070E71CB|nr:MMPL family transporter [Loigolactobacillus bifermentans]QGG60951.1 MMPL family transporter [Loigolactobacillus bifermentans]